MMWVLLLEESESGGEIAKGNQTGVASNTTHPHS